MKIRSEETFNLLKNCFTDEKNSINLSQLKLGIELEKYFKQFMENLREIILIHNFQIENIFKNFLLEGEELLDFKEFSIFLKTLDYQISEERNNYIFFKFDLDCDNKISYLDFKKVINDKDNDANKKKEIYNPIINQNPRILRKKTTIIENSNQNVKELIKINRKSQQKEVLDKDINGKLKILLNSTDIVNKKEIYLEKGRVNVFLLKNVLKKFKDTLEHIELKKINFEARFNFKNKFKLEFQRTEALETLLAEDDLGISNFPNIKSIEIDLEINKNQLMRMDQYKGQGEILLGDKLSPIIIDNINKRISNDGGNNKRISNVDNDKRNSVDNNKRNSIENNKRISTVKNDNIDKLDSIKEEVEVENGNVNVYKGEKSSVLFKRNDDENENSIINSEMGQIESFDNQIYLDLKDEEREYKRIRWIIQKKLYVHKFLRSFFLEESATIIQFCLIDKIAFQYTLSQLKKNPNIKSIYFKNIGNYLKKAALKQIEEKLRTFNKLTEIHFINTILNDNHLSIIRNFLRGKKKTITVISFINNGLNYTDLNNIFFGNNLLCQMEKLKKIEILQNPLLPQIILSKLKDEEKVDFEKVNVRIPGLRDSLKEIENNSKMMKLYFANCFTIDNEDAFKLLLLKLIEKDSCSYLDLSYNESIGNNFTQYSKSLLVKCFLKTKQLLTWKLRKSANEFILKDIIKRLRKKNITLAILEVDLSENDYSKITQEDFRILFTSFLWMESATTRKIILSDCQLNDNHIEGIALIPDKLDKPENSSPLEVFNISKNPAISPHMWVKLFRTLIINEKSKKIRSFDIGYCDLKDEVVVGLIKEINDFQRPIGLEELILAGNNTIDKVQWKNLMKTMLFGDLVHLKLLDISNCGLNDDIIESIIEPLKIKDIDFPLSELILNENKGISSKGWKNLSEYLIFHEKSEIEVLSISDCNLNYEKFNCLMFALNENIYLEKLNLSNNPLICWWYLADFLKDIKNLRILDISRCAQDLILRKGDLKVLDNLNTQDFICTTMEELYFVDYYYCNSIDFVNDLKYILSSFPRLKKLDLRMSFFKAKDSKITVSMIENYFDKAINDNMEMLKYLEDLTININFNKDHSVWKLLNFLILDEKSFLSNLGLESDGYGPVYDLFDLISLEATKFKYKNEVNSPKLRNNWGKIQKFMLNKKINIIDKISITNLGNNCLNHDIVYRWFRDIDKIDLNSSGLSDLKYKKMAYLLSEGEYQRRKPYLELNFSNVIIPSNTWTELINRVIFINRIYSTEQIDIFKSLAEINKEEEEEEDEEKGEQNKISNKRKEKKKKSFRKKSYKKSKSFFFNEIKQLQSNKKEEINTNYILSLIKLNKYILRSLENVSVNHSLKLVECFIDCNFISSTNIRNFSPLIFGKFSILRRAILWNLSKRSKIQAMIDGSTDLNYQFLVNDENTEDLDLSLINCEDKGFENEWIEFSEKLLFTKHSRIKKVLLNNYSLLINADFETFEKFFKGIKTSNIKVIDIEFVNNIKFNSIIKDLAGFIHSDIIPLKDERLLRAIEKVYEKVFFKQDSAENKLDNDLIEQEFFNFNLFDELNNIILYEDEEEVEEVDNEKKEMQRDNNNPLDKFTLEFENEELEQNLKIHYYKNTTTQGFEDKFKDLTPEEQLKQIIDKENYQSLITLTDIKSRLESQNFTEKLKLKLFVKLDEELKQLLRNFSMKLISYKDFPLYQVYKNKNIKKLYIDQDFISFIRYVCGICAKDEKNFPYSFIFQKSFYETIMENQDEICEEFCFAPFSESRLFEMIKDSSFIIRIYEQLKKNYNLKKIFIEYYFSYTLNKNDSEQFPNSKTKISQILPDNRQNINDINPLVNDDNQAAREIQKKKKIRKKK